MMNKFSAMGRLTGDPKITYSQGENPVCVARYTLAVDRAKKNGQDNGTDFIPCKAIGSTGEFVEKYLKKGQLIIVHGSIETGSYVNKEGTKIYTTEVRVKEHEFVPSQRKDGDAVPAATAPAAATTAPATDDGFMDVPDDEEELPFN